MVAVLGPLLYLIYCRRVYVHVCAFMYTHRAESVIVLATGTVQIGICGLLILYIQTSLHIQDRSSQTWYMSHK